MEKQLNAKISEYFKKFKDELVLKLKDQDIQSDENGSNIINFIYSYPHVSFKKEEFNKRKRIKNSIPLHDRCVAIRANCEQCTRRRKNNEKFCGTHIKGTPHGVVTDGKPESSSYFKINVWAEEISGIIHYLDTEGNVYDPQDIFQNVTDPRIISHYKKEDDKYIILN